MYQVISKQSGKCLDVPGSSLADGAGLIINPCTGGSNQLFVLRDLGGPFGVTNVNSGKCLDLAGATAGTILTQRTCAGVPTQRFNLQVGVASTITDVPSGLCIEVFGGVSVDGTPVDGWTCHVADNQTWTVRAVSTGTCMPESDGAFCARLGIGCDRWTGVDNCGATRTVICGPCIALQQSCGLVKANACGDIGKVNLARGGTVTASITGTAPSDMTKAFDEMADTQWFVNSSVGWLAYQFAAGARNVVTSYSVTSAPDWPDTDPKSWTLEGANGGAWTVLDTRSGQGFLGRGQTNFYTFANATAYNRYRLNVTLNNGSTNLHLAEIQLFR